MVARVLLGRYRALLWQLTCGLAALHEVFRKILNLPSLFQEFTMTTYAAFLRGINVGGHHIISMSDLRREFSKFGMQEIKTILNSGNVRFKTGEKNIPRLQSGIQTHLEAVFGFPIPVIIRTMNHISALIDKNPFSTVKATSDTRFYLSFLKRAPRESPALPITSEDGAYTILSHNGAEVFSVMDKALCTTPNVMALLEKTFGSEITTRKLDTVIKVINFK